MEDTSAPSYVRNRLMLRVLETICVDGRNHGLRYRTTGRVAMPWALILDFLPLLSAEVSVADHAAECYL